MGGGSINFPDPNEVGAAQFSWNNLNQYTPYGSVEYTPPEFDAMGNPISPGSMTQNYDPALLALQESMLGLRGSALGRLAGMFGSNSFGFGDQPIAPQWPSPPTIPGTGGGWGSSTGDDYQFDQRRTTMTPEQMAQRGLLDPKLAGGGGRITYPHNRTNIQNPGLAGGGGGGGITYPHNRTNIRNPATAPVYDTPDHRYRGSEIIGGTDSLNDLFYSSSAPALKTGYNMGSLPGLLGEGDLTGERDRITQAKFDRMKGLLDPVFADKKTALAEQMANRGMPVGAEEYSILSDELGRQESNAYINAALDADLAGGDELSRLAGLSAQQRGQRFGEQTAGLNLSNQARQQAFGETMGVRDSLLRSMLGLGSFGLQQQGQEYNQLASLLGLTQAPGAGGDLSQFYGPSPVDMMGAYGMNQQGQMYNAGNNISGAGLMSGLFGLGGAAMGGGMFG